MGSKPKDSNVQIRIDAELLKSFRIKVLLKEDQDVNMSDVLRRFIRQYVGKDSTREIDL